MIFKVTGTEGKKQTFEGFKIVKGPRRKGILAVVFFEGECDIWYLDPECEIALDELKRLYRSDGYEGVIIQVWKDGNFTTTIEV